MKVGDNDDESGNKYNIPKICLKYTQICHTKLIVRPTIIDEETF